MPSTAELTAPAIVRFDDLSPTWEAPRAREPGFIRWIVSYVGGVPPFWNNNPETGLVSGRVAIGVMWLPVGNRQSGVHVHSITEIYVILRGRVESIELSGRRHVAGPLDCLVMPPGAPHAVRAIGDEDVVLLWVHDKPEEAGSSAYFDESEPPPPGGAPQVQLVTWDSLEPSWDLPKAKSGGHLRYATSWVGGAEGFEHYNRGVGAINDRVSLGAVVMPPGNSEVPHSYATPRHYLVVSGRGTVVGDRDAAPLGPLDLVVLPPSVPHALRTVGTDPLRLVSFHEELQPEGSAQYVEAC